MSSSRRLSLWMTPVTAQDMPQDHDHDHCSDQAHIHDHDHDHDHSHDSSTLGPQDNLFSRIDLDRVMVLNGVEPAEGSAVIKPWDQRMDESKSLVSDQDDQLILRIPFTDSVKLRAILIKAGPAGQTPAKVALYANGDDLDFEDVESRPATQEFDIPQGREVGEYTVKAARFSNLSHITLFFPSSQGAENVRLFYIGFLGQWNKLHKGTPVVALYEAQANPADHEKIQGTEGAFNTPQT